MKLLPILVLFLIKSLKFEYLPYQAHSFNNTKKIRQLIIKGALYFKIDVDAISEEGCKKYGDRDNYDAFNIHYDVVAVCLGLLGDSSGAPFPLSNFQTSDTFIDFLQSNDMIKLLSINYAAFNQISLDQSMMFDFFGKLIDISIQSQGKIKFGIEPCIPQMLREYCVGIIQKLCNKFEYIYKLRDTDQFYCSNNQEKQQDKQYFYSITDNIKQHCQNDLKNYQSSIQPFEFFTLNNSDQTIQTIKYLNTECSQLNNHSYMLGSNLDIDQFRIIYYMQHTQSQRIYFSYKIKDDLNYVNYFYVQNYNILIIILEKENIQYLQLVRFDQNQIKIINQAIIAQHAQINNYDFQDNNLYLYNDSDIYKIEITQDSLINFQESKNQNNCQVILHNDLQDYYCINLIVNTDKTYSVSFELIRKSIIIHDGEQIVFSLPSNILNIENLQVYREKENFIISFTNQIIDNLNNIHEYSYIMHMNLINKKISNYLKFIGHIENLDINQNQIIILVNNQQIGQGSKFLNGNDKNMCSNEVTYFDQTYDKINQNYNLGYYYGNLKSLIDLKDNKYLTLCDESFIHGSLGFAEKSNIRFVKNMDRQIPLVIKKGLKQGNINQFQNFFGGHIKQDLENDLLNLIEIETDTFLNY